MDPLLQLVQSSAPTTALLAVVAYLARAYLAKIDNGIERMNRSLEEHTRRDEERLAVIEQHLAVVRHVLPDPRPRAVD